MKHLSDKVCCCLEEEHRPNLQETAWHVHILKINHDDTWGWCWLFLLLTGIFALMKTLFERQLYEHIHHEYKCGEHFDSLSSRQPRSDLLRSLCCAPLLTASIVITLFSLNICLQEEAVCPSLLATFPRRPARVSEGRRAAPCTGAPRPVLHRHPSVLGDRLYQLIFPWHHAGKLWQNADDLQTRGPSPAKWKHPKYLLFQGAFQTLHLFQALLES